MDNNNLITIPKYYREFFESKIPCVREAYILKEWLVCQLDNPDRTEEFYFETTLNSLQDKLTTLTRDEFNDILDKLLSDDEFCKRTQSIISAMGFAGI